MMAWALRSLRLILLAFALMLVVAGCKNIDTRSAFDALDGATVTPVPVPSPTAVVVPTPVAPPPLPFSGPTLRSHWHAAFIVRICDRVLDPLPDVTDNQGIHSHGDGLIHIHPRAAEAAFDRATIDDFLTVVGIDIEEDEAGRVITGEVPGQGQWANGDRCGDEPGEWTLHRWARAGDEGPVESLRERLTEARFLNDGELFSLNFAPASAPPIKPTAIDALFAASPGLLEPLPAPFVNLPPVLESDSFSIWPVELITEAPCGPGFVPAQDESRCYQRGGAAINRGDITSGTAYLVGPVPGVVMDIEPDPMAIMNGVLSGSLDGRQLAVEINGRVQILAFTPGPFPQPRITIAGGLTVEDAERIAEILNTAI